MISGCQSPVRVISSVGEARSGVFLAVETVVDRGEVGVRGDWEDGGRVRGWSRGRGAGAGDREQRL